MGRTDGTRHGLAFAAPTGRRGARRLAGALPVAMVVMMFAVGVAWGLMINSQVASAELTAASSSDFTLHICEPGAAAPTATPLEPEGWCPVDDDGGGVDLRDELVFEDVSSLTPGEIVLWDVRLVNAGNASAWDLWSYDVDIAEKPDGDPGDDCTVPLELLNLFDLGVAIGDGGTFPDPNQHGGRLTYDVYNDNHNDPITGVPDAIELPPYARVVHVEAGEYEDVRLRVRLPADAGNECLDTTWTLSIQFNVAAHS